MAIEVSENWSDQNLALAGDVKTWTAQRGFIVTGISNETEATIASGSPYGTIPQVNEVHPRNRFLRVNKVTPQRISPVACHVIIAYGVGQQPSQQDPLADKPRIRWQLGSTTEPIDRDVEGNPIVNSAGDAFDPPLNTEFTTLFLTYTRNEPYFDIQKALTYSNTVNSNSFTIRGAGIVAPGQIKCDSIQPAGEYTDDADFVPIVYSFEIRRGNKQDSDGSWDGFKLRVLDQGLRAYYDINKGPARIYDPDQSTAASRSPVTSDVRLDGYGGTFDDSYFVTDTLQQSVSKGSAPTGAIVEVGDTACFLKYKRLRTISFAGLNL
jgi:hypothetical protein